ncbi:MULTISPECIES: MFS transporter [unclassified Streptomyces]|uniref:MFS transporter n=1 Tax=unclassified Streptomyces TaxID=2593676 RepID=UPI002DD842C2|nr:MULTISPECIES: MFS transporter [unclassified Streptomyces]WSB79681.1 MFS transporter [Streptomyces sp. NBC_01775]WSS12116.1 MFS transporter [Streptomyces sp. NBC_01186]WSS40827.1 MFS transporter [Streptomyces sp. NBC_01187]
MTAGWTSRRERRTGRAPWINHWEPEDPGFWAREGRRTARRNLWLSVFAEHTGFAVWSLWSVLVLFMTPETGFALSADDKFLLVSVVSLVGAVLRLPYGFAVTRVGGRTWTVCSAVALLVPTVLAAVLMRRPETPLWALLGCAALAGLGGGNFASSMVNINHFFPEREKGWALGLNAGGGNLGVASVQLLGLLVLATVGAAHPEAVPLLLVPALALAALLAHRHMDNLATARTDYSSYRAAVRDPHCWIVSLLYVGTFGSFIGFGFAFGLVLQNDFGRTPVQAAVLAVLGPLLGSLARPLGGRLADRWGGARVTAGAFAAMALCGAGALAASAAGSFAGFVAAFIALFVLTGLGNGSTYKMIPAIYAARAESAVEAGRDPQEARAESRRRAGAVIAISGAVGALGGVGINLAFRQSYQAAGDAGPAIAAFLAFYVLCLAVTCWVYLRRPVAGTPADREAEARSGAGRTGADRDGTGQDADTRLDPAGTSAAGPGA